MKKIVFVCTGNICRSPMAEYLFRHRAGEQDQWEAASAGLFAGVGSPASENSVRALAEWAIDLTPHRSQPMTAELASSADLIVAMADHHRDELVSGLQVPGEKVRLMMSFGTGNETKNVHDPIGSSLHVYKTVRDQIDSGISDLILYLIDKGELAPKGANPKS